jgi:glycosyltransferase involved in cell wall biosynthesis
MKICILTPRFPFPENAGDVLRINNVCRYLKSKGHTLILVSYGTKNNAIPEEPLYDTIYWVKRNKIVSFINSIFAILLNKPIQIGYYFSFAYLLKFKQTIKLEHPDLFVSHLLRMVPYLNICHLQNRSIVDFPDAFSKMYTLAAKVSYLSLKKLIYSFEKKRIADYEKKTISTYKKCVLVSQADKEFLGNPSSVYVYPNGIRYLSEICNEYNTNKIVFVGNMRTLQNQDAVQYFINNIFPIIKLSIFNAVFYIIGAEPPVAIQNLADGQNIIVSGYVNSIENIIKDAAIAIAPVRIAAGIQNKVLISMACGIPVVLTPAVAEGIPELISEKNCIITNKENDFANAVTLIMQNKNIRNAIGRAGYELIKEKYSLNIKLKGYEE